MSRKAAAAALLAAVVAAGAFGDGIKSFVSGMEGVETVAYADPGPRGWTLPTICVGHTGPDVRIGQRATMQECMRWLDKDLLKSGESVAHCVTAPITPGQFDALVSFEFNTGSLCKSTLVRKLNAGDCRGASAEFSRWVTASGRVLPGLVRRRAAEREMFEKDC